MANIALQGANPSYFPNVNDQGLPILNQKALDSVLSRYKGNSLTSNQYRDNYNKFGWNVKSDSSYVRRGPAVVGLDIGNIQQGMSVGPKGIVKVGTNSEATDADFKNAAQQLGIDYSGYIKPTKFVPNPNSIYVEQPNARNSRQYTDPNTGETYLARIDPKGNFQTTLDKQGLFNQISNQTKDLYLVGNALDRTGYSANKASPHASILFKADGSGNLVPVQKQDGSIAYTPYQGVGVHHSDGLGDLMPLLGIAGLAFGIPALSGMLGGTTAALTAGEVGALGAAEGAGLAGMGAGAGLGTGTMAGTMLGTGGELLGTTAGIAGGLSSAGLLGSGNVGGLADLPIDVPDLSISSPETVINPETGLPGNPNAPGYQIDPTGPAKIGSQCLGIPKNPAIGSQNLLQTAKDVKKLYDAGKTLFGGAAAAAGGFGGGLNSGTQPAFLESTPDFLNKNKILGNPAALKTVHRDQDNNVELLGADDAQGQNMPNKIDQEPVSPLGYAGGGSSINTATNNQGNFTNAIKEWNSAFCEKKLTPSFVKCEVPEFLFSKKISESSKLKPIRQTKVNPLATGGLPHKYAAAAPKGHKPEFITGMTGYYACGAGTGQSDDIPAMLHDGDYVMDAETVSALGDGSSKAGREVLEGFRERIPHKKEGGSNPVPAKIADGEYVFPAAFVTALGGGDNKRGAEILDGLRTKLRAHKRGAPLDKIPPKAKDPIEYIKTRSK